MPDATPAAYDRDALAPVILERIAGGASLRSVCEADDTLPAHSTFLLWVSEDPDLADQYARAREAGTDHEFDEIREIADEADPTPDGLAHAKLRIDARKWRLAKMQPKKYGEQIGPTVANQINISAFPPPPTEPS